MTESSPTMHVSLYVSSLTKTIEFYNRFFGRPPAKTKPGYVKYMLENPALVISFVENRDRVQPHFGHLGFRVDSPEDLAERLEAAKADNLVALEETGTNCCYATQDKFWVSDPDNIQWEVYYFHKDAEFNDPQFELDKEDTCCTVSSPASKSDCGCSATVRDSESKAVVCC